MVSEREFLSLPSYLRQIPLSSLNQAIQKINGAKEERGHSQSQLTAFVNHVKLNSLKLCFHISSGDTQLCPLRMPLNYFFIAFHATLRNLSDCPSEINLIVTLLLLLQVVMRALHGF